MERLSYGENVIRDGLVFGVLFAYIVDSLLTAIKSRYGRRNIAEHTLSDERFLVA